MNITLPQLIVGLAIVGAVVSSNRVEPTAAQVLATFKPAAFIEVRPASVTSKVPSVIFGFGLDSNASTVSVQGREEIHFAVVEDVSNSSSPKCSKHATHCLVSKPTSDGKTESFMLTQDGGSVRLRKGSEKTGGAKLSRASVPMGTKLDRITLKKNETIVRVGSLYISIKN
ncbi:MAG: hypothetical protein ACI8TQ_000808 [Planctomycetota bacterium]|jgi:hypothetical protein